MRNIPDVFAGVSRPPLVVCAVAIVRLEAFFHMAVELMLPLDVLIASRQYEDAATTSAVLRDVDALP